MTDASVVRGRITDAVSDAETEGVTRQLERLFARLFHGLVYAQIWEDPVADMEALDIGPDDHVVCISSGGCNMMSYLTAGPAGLSAVDLSPAHVALGRLKLTAARTLRQGDFRALFAQPDRASNLRLFKGVSPYLDAETRAWWQDRDPIFPRTRMLTNGLYRHGVLGRFIGAVQLMARFGGVDFHRYLKSATLEDQRAFFDAEIAPQFDRPSVRWLARRKAVLFGLGIPPAQYDKLAADGDGDIIPVLKERSRKLFCGFPLQENYFAWQACRRGYGPGPDASVPPYLEPSRFAALAAAAPRATLENRSMTDMLAATPDGTRDVFVLLDAQDWMTDAQLAALWTEITRTARPGARVLYRTGGAPDILPGRVPDALLNQWTYDRDASRRATDQDRSAIYGAVHLWRKHA
ncbi:MAG: DUF3419 family protein [Pseudomonadota bacterium]